MPIRPVVVYGEPVLHRRAAEVEVIDDEETTGPDDFTALSIGGVDEDGDRFWFVEEDLT